MQRADKGCAVEKCRYALQKALMRLLRGREGGIIKEKKDRYATSQRLTANE